MGEADLSRVGVDGDGSKVGRRGVEEMGLEDWAAPRIDLWAGRIESVTCLWTVIPLRTSVDGRPTEMIGE